ncbi:hypothetical protein B9Z65_6114 [Elsinoe australis]|uniref:Methylated-DNA--protein-cysteine methyltransferase n=1 Tax=Elsinoe australis TaxID=40998 RepID=A0A2P8A7P6_9PEZI|nr:hypothetical protein B9Z65_6114 [Elsinoe australis]
MTSASSSPPDEFSPLREKWLTLHRTTLPSLAKAKSPSQPHWPVVLDHCFARIILDNAVGVDKPWNQVLKAPAYRNMGRGQLKAAIGLGERIAAGEVNLVELDERSLGLRGKGSKVGRKGKAGGGVAKEEEGAVGERGTGLKRKVADDGKTEESNLTGKKRKQSKDGTVSSYFLPSPKAETAPTSPRKSRSSDPSPKQEATPEDKPDPQRQPDSKETPEAVTAPETEIKTLRNPITNATYPSAPPLELIEKSTLTPFRKQVLALLCQVPEGKYTTYAALATHITAASHKTCARAVGNAMRNNPFAPVVPCHRVLATGGKIGGFGGEWGDDGKFAGRKREMLRGEGVRFDGGGKVVGEVWRGFK